MRRLPFPRPSAAIALPSLDLPLPCTAFLENPLPFPRPSAAFALPFLDLPLPFLDLSLPFPRPSTAFSSTFALLSHCLSLTSHCLSLTSHWPFLDLPSTFFALLSHCLSLHVDRVCTAFSLAFALRVDGRLFTALFCQGRADDTEATAIRLMERFTADTLPVGAETESWHLSCERGRTRDDYGKAGPFSVERLKTDLRLADVLCAQCRPSWQRPCFPPHGQPLMAGAAIAQWRASAEGRRQRCARWCHTHGGVRLTAGYSPYSV